ncbi:MAG: VWA domain-containing protein [Myxococcota bacterium]|nr:VWA domain-containing protein [Myxococcota bacterium]
MSEILPASLVVAVGCTQLQLTTIKATQQRPSNVAVYFKVRTGSGDPVGGLTANSFRIYEDGQLVSQYESKQTILNPQVAAIHYTLLLVDMSGSVSESGNGDVIAQAVGTFTERVEKEQKVAIYAFDGSPNLYPIVPFTDQAGSAKAGVQTLASFKPKDPSTNLNGAVVKALDELDAALGKANQPLKFGTVVVFTDGTDRANRVPADAMTQHIREKPFDVFAIGLGAEIKEEQLKEIGKSGTAMAADKNAVVNAFDEVGAKVEARTKSFYLLSYCSPSRAGKHEVRIEAAVDDGQGKSAKTGSLQTDFDATGFAPGCNPNTPPSFDVTKGDALAPPPEKEPKVDQKRDEKRTEKKKDEKKEPKPPPKAPSAGTARPAPPSAPALQPTVAPPAEAPPPPSKPQDFNP